MPDYLLSGFLWSFALSPGLWRFQAGFGYGWAGCFMHCEPE
jgi:hypothetical protein